MLDLEPATTALTRLINGVRDDQLDGPTPCADITVAGLLDHINGLSQAFAAAAAKTPLPGGPSADASRLGDDWRTRIPGHLAALAKAWSDPSAWDGMTAAGGVDLPGQVAGLVALDEVIVHSWDLAAATGQSYDVDPALVAGARGFVESAVQRNPEGSPGLFKAPVAVPADASPLTQLIGLTGRDPAWQPA